MKRRTFLKAGGAGLAMPALSCLTTGSTAGLLSGMATNALATETGAHLISAANNADNETFLIGLSREGDIRFSLPVPSRGHAAALHPNRPEAVAFARRPGTFAVVIDCANGKEIARLPSPQGRHFYGHGAFTADGAYLLTTENDYDAPAGRIGIWQTAPTYKRIGEVPSHGIGPHEIIRLSDGSFAVANGGIQTHPDFARSKLNLHKMQPNLSIIDANGTLLDQTQPPKELSRNSIRHIVADDQDRIYIALQWQGNPMKSVPLAASFKRGEDLKFHDHPDMVRLKQFGGSIAISGDGSQWAITSPKGNHIIFFDAKTSQPLGSKMMSQASGATYFNDGFAFTVKGGLVFGNNTSLEPLQVKRELIWDNHLVPVA